MKRRDRRGRSDRRWWSFAAAGLAGLAVLLGLRRLRDRRAGEPEAPPPVRVPQAPAAEPPAVAEPPEISEVVEPPRPLHEPEPPEVAEPPEPTTSIPPATREKTTGGEVRVEDEAPGRRRLWAGAAVLATVAAVVIAAVTVAGPDERDPARLGDLDPLGCTEAAEWLSTLDLEVRTDLLEFAGGFFVFGTTGDVTYVTPSRLYADVSEIYEVRRDDVTGAGLISYGANWPDGVSVSTDGDNFSCSRGAAAAGDCHAHERLLRSLRRGERRRLYRAYERIAVSLLTDARARVVAYDGEESGSFLLARGDLRPDPSIAAAYAYAPGPALDFETRKGRPQAPSC